MVFTFGKNLVRFFDSFLPIFETMLSGNDIKRHQVCAIYVRFALIYNTFSVDFIEFAFTIFLKFQQFIIYHSSVTTFTRLAKIEKIKSLLSNAAPCACVLNQKWQMMHFICGFISRSIGQRILGKLFRNQGIHYLHKKKKKSSKFFYCDHGVR